jgi:VIT1/CCC1 family predicted Fe2+/Mn2+ transporter
MSQPTRRILDPVERTSEILFGLIMVLTFTGSIMVAEAGQAEMREILVGAVGCNFAWGIVDAVMYLMTNLTERARALKTLEAVRGAVGADRAHQIIRAALPGPLASVIKDAEIESLRQRLEHVDVPPDARLNARDFTGALGVFLLVFLSTFPVVIPFLIMRDVHSALRMSNLTAAALLFATGWTLGRYAGRGGFRSGVETLAIAIVLVALTMALGG